MTIEPLTVYDRIGKLEDQVSDLQGELDALIVWAMGVTRKDGLSAYRPTYRRKRKGNR